MTQDKPVHPTLHTALHLDGSADALKTFYAGWSDRYEADTLSWGYAAPDNALDLLRSAGLDPALQVDPQDPDLRILDAGCGTGLMAKKLDAAGYRNIDGFDLSPEMVEIARQSGLYRNLAGGVDINAPVRSAWRDRYDCTISIGVFTPGHVPPESLSRLVDLTRPGGIIIVSTRVAYCVSEHYESCSQKLEARGRIRLLASRRDAPYTTDEAAHYWLYARSAP